MVINTIPFPPFIQMYKVTKLCTTKRYMNETGALWCFIKNSSTLFCYIASYNEPEQDAECSVHNFDDLDVVYD